jgi:site-specific DNA-methyltransferase (adenine-specific)
MIQITHEDNMELMAWYPDNHFDLAIVDPPYGIKDKIIKGGLTKKRKSKFHRNADSVNWDKLPSKKYFEELFRVSKNQIIWGSNYFNLAPTRCNLIWDKMQEFTGADFELAWTSFDKASKAFRMSRIEAYSNGKIHPTQKPVKLYEWLLMNYAKEGDKILDTHGGSMSIALACHNLGFDLTLCELDKEYYEAGLKRLKQHQQQLTMF